MALILILLRRRASLVGSMSLAHHPGLVTGRRALAVLPLGPACLLQQNVISKVIRIHPRYFSSQHMIRIVALSTLPKATPSPPSPQPGPLAPSPDLSRRHALGFIACAPIAFAPSLAHAASSSAGDWSSPGLASVEDADQPKFFKTASGVPVQQLNEGAGKAAQRGDRVLMDYVLRRGNGYFIYSTVEGVSFQPSDIPTGPVVLTLVSGDGRPIAVFIFRPYIHSKSRQICRETP